MTGVQTQLRNHVALEHELSGNEQQVMTVICGLQCADKIQVSKISIKITWYVNQIITIFHRKPRNL